MRRKNIILTLWFIAPLAVFAGLYALIFITLDKDKLMADAPAIGAGAGDTGNANALGQWLAGRDPDAVSLATKAKRERLLIDPRDWPGGIELMISGELLTSGKAQIELRREDQVETVAIESGVPVRLTQSQVDGVAIWLVQPGAEDIRIFTELRIPAASLQTSDAMVVAVEL